MTGDGIEPMPATKRNYKTLKSWQSPSATALNQKFLILFIFRYVNIDLVSKTLVEQLDNMFGNPDDVTWEKSDFDDVFKKEIRNIGKTIKEKIEKDEL